MKLYEIEQSIAQLLDTADPVTGEIDAEALTSLEVAKHEKQLSVTQFIRHLENDSEVIEKEIGRLESLLKTTNARKEWLKGYLKKSMEIDGMDVLDFTTFKAKIKKNPPKLVVTDEKKLLEKYGKEKTTVVLDKTAVKDAIQKGEEVKGAYVVQETRLDIL